jgi:hypothetical protein
MQKEISDDPRSQEEIARIRDAAIRRALNTPPKPLKELVGKTERAQSQRESREIKARRAKPIASA